MLYMYKRSGEKMKITFINVDLPCTMTHNWTLKQLYNNLLHVLID